MDTLSHFRSIEELVKMFDREKDLLRDMFERRTSHAYRTDIAMEVVDYKRERIQYLIEYGVIHENCSILEMEDVYVQFFEEVLDMNSEISVASVKEYIDSLKQNIDYYLKEEREYRKNEYQAAVRKILRRIGLRTLKNVVDLKRNVEVAYKQEPNYKIKKDRLIKLDEKRKGIIELMRQCEMVMDQQVGFFNTATDPTMYRTCMDVRNDFTDADHNLLEIERQIIDYINQIEQQSALYKKVRRLKYLKDQLTWKEETNVLARINSTNGLWMEKRPYSRYLISLETLRTNEDAYSIIRKIGKKQNILRMARTEAEPISEEYLIDDVKEMEGVNTTEIWNSFKAQGNHLFAFIRNYDYKIPRTIQDHIILFCQMATMYSDELRFTDTYETSDQIEYALIYAR